MSWATAAWAALLCALACIALSSLARHLRWTDRPDGHERHRKLQAAPVPAVGGAAILIGLVGARLWVPGFGAASLAGATELGLWSALGLAFGVGLVDDSKRGGLSPALKLLGQTAAGVALAWPLIFAPQAASLSQVLFLVLGAVVAQNAWNTFDNADGAATSLAALGLAAVGAWPFAAVLAFLPFNLLAARASPTPGVESAAGAARRTPYAYLGDSGSHLLGLLLFAIPAAWPLFSLPLLDLARVALERLAAGVAPWVGDRRHLAHRLQARGLGAFRVCGLLTLISLPAALGAFSERGPGPGHASIGIALSALAFAAAVLWSRSEHDGAR